MRSDFDLERLFQSYRGGTRFGLGRKLCKISKPIVRGLVFAPVNGSLYVSVENGGRCDYLITITPSPETVDPLVLVR